MVGVDPEALPLVATALRAFGFDYLQCQGGYDEGPGGRLVSFYHLVKLAVLADPAHADRTLAPEVRPEEVRLKVFLPRDGSPTIPTFKTPLRSFGRGMIGGVGNLGKKTPAAPGGDRGMAPDPANG